MGIEERLAVLQSQMRTPPKKKWYKKWWGILVILIILFICGFIVASAIYIYNTAVGINNGKISAESLAQATEAQKLIEGNGGYYLGSNQPLITIVEFSDFACPFCRDSYLAVRAVGLKYHDQVKIIYRDFLGHDDSLQLALAARCAGEQGHFWEMHDQLFENQGQITAELMTSLVKKIGADPDKFNNCVANQRYLNDIKKDNSDASQLEITGTPTWFIGGYKLQGAMSRDNFFSLIDQVLKEYQK
jgi:protein-disulfide isomerase